jgi:GTPase_EngA: ribosome-associated GTPase EngA
MSLNNTPAANRLHIVLFGKRNSGKSSLINALTGQDTALVSDIPGTTTDAVSKAMEIQHIGPCLFIDTPGFDDEGELGEMRITRTLKAIERTDIALLLCEDGNCEDEKQWMEQLNKRNIPVILILNKADIRKDIASTRDCIEKECGQSPLIISAKEQTGIEKILQAILEKLPADFGQQTITGDLVKEGDLALSHATRHTGSQRPTYSSTSTDDARIIGKKCLVMSCTTDKIAATLQALSYPPKLIITDSQVFHAVYEQKPAESLLTSFSVLMAGYKGDILYYMEGASAIDRLTPQSRVLIAEACTHAPATEDIGRVKLPRMLRKKIGEELQIDIVAGTDFPEDLTPYHLIIHCGACMFNRKYVLNRIDNARKQQIPMTNYGVAIAHLNGILDKIAY